MDTSRITVHMTLEHLALTDTHDHHQAGGHPMPVSVGEKALRAFRTRRAGKPARVLGESAALRAGRAAQLGRDSHEWGVRCCREAQWSPPPSPRSPAGPTPNWVSELSRSSATSTRRRWLDRRSPCARRPRLLYAFQTTF